MTKAAVIVRPVKTPISLGIRPVWSAFTVRMKKASVLSYPLRASEDWSDWANALADLSLRWAHTHFVGFVMSRLILWCFTEWAILGFLEVWTCIQGISSLYCSTTQRTPSLTLPWHTLNTTLRIPGNQTALLEWRDWLMGFLERTVRITIGIFLGTYEMGCFLICKLRDHMNSAFSKSIFLSF